MGKHAMAIESRPGNLTDLACTDPPHRFVVPYQRLTFVGTCVKCGKTMRFDPALQHRVLVREDVPLA